MSLSIAVAMVVSVTTALLAIGLNETLENQMDNDDVGFEKWFTVVGIAGSLLVSTTVLPMFDHVGIISMSHQLLPTQIGLLLTVYVLYKEFPK